MYTKNSRILHLGNVANTGLNAVGWARRSGRNWALRPIPAAPNMASASAWLARGADAARYAIDVPSPDLAHVHYGPNGYYGELKGSPYVLHLHGTDLRQDLHRPLIGHLERLALKRADAVIVATPDLLPAARELRPDAVWIPNALPTRTFLNASTRDQEQPPAKAVPTVFFSARWDDSKGGLGLVELARGLISEGINVVGVDWGTYSAQAASAGVDLLPMLSPAAFVSALGGADVIVGQFGCGSLTISELEAMSTGVPLISYVENEEESSSPLLNRTLSEAGPAVLSALSSPESTQKLAESAQAWVLTNRSPEATARATEDVYRSVLG